MKGFKEKIQDPCDGVDARLKEKGLYFYKDDGSVFMDYKILRRIARIKVGESLGETDKEKAESRGYGIFCDRFNLETSIEKLLAQAREFVGTWAWSE
ncbi:hypothetical protein M1563_05010 [Patescibacteria group bacterium]|nr:hypothetical protein [Patescibacteria group bacterium]MCL5409441.1 hypothetical protein [Patescibacteria group bacterium]